MAKLQLVVVTHARKVLDLECDEVVLPGRQGELGILPGHAAFVGSLRPGVLQVVGGDSLAVTAGFCEVSDNIVTVLTERAASKDEVDSAAVRDELQEAERRLERAEPEELVKEQDAVAWAEARLAL